jgi:hypothetical protein
LAECYGAVAENLSSDPFLIKNWILALDNLEVQLAPRTALLITGLATLEKLMNFRNDSSAGNTDLTSVYCPPIAVRVEALFKVLRKLKT